MNIVIIGGGKLGYSLAINMLDRDFRVNVIEKNKAVSYTHLDVYKRQMLYAVLITAQI